jgi:signal transduction histidine kinase
LGGPVVAELGPQPGVGELGELVASTRQAGADVWLEGGVPTGLDPAVELAAYRVVQEALSNAVRHAPKAEVQVTVRRRGDELVLKVWNGPARSEQRPVPGSGHGLIGMRERVALLDGTVSMGPTLEGGYLVEASIPAGEEVASGDQGAGG